MLKILPVASPPTASTKLVPWETLLLAALHGRHPAIAASRLWLIVYRVLLCTVPSNARARGPFSVYL